MDLIDSDHGRIVLMILIVFLSVLMTRLVRWCVSWIYKKRSRKKEIDAGGLLLAMFVLDFIIILVGISYAISVEPSIESVSKSFLASAGIVTIIAGLAGRQILSNFFAGVMIIVSRPFTIGHWIKVGEDHEGKVEKIKLLYTVVREYSNRRVIIENSKILSSYIENSSYHDTMIYQGVKFNISYDSDVKKARKIIQEIALANPLVIDNRSEKEIKKGIPIVNVRIKELGELSITLLALVWVENAASARRIQWELNEPIKDKFEEEGIELAHFKEGQFIRS